jgi:MarR family transcriptional regulator, lower aerobic nicotinate degradation pathway regulator
VSAGAPDARAVGEAVLNAAARLTDLLGAACAEEALTPTEARLLRTLREDVPQGRLGALLALDPARVSALTGALEQRGLLERVPSVSDRRHRHARLTPEGAAAVRRIGERLAARSPLNRLAPADRARLVALLDQAWEGEPTCGA